MRQVSASAFAKNGQRSNVNEVWREQIPALTYVRPTTTTMQESSHQHPQRYINTAGQPSDLQYAISNHHHLSQTRQLTTMPISTYLRYPRWLVVYVLVGISCLLTVIAHHVYKHEHINYTNYATIQDSCTHQILVLAIRTWFFALLSWDVAAVVDRYCALEDRLDKVEAERKKV